MHLSYKRLEITLNCKYRNFKISLSECVYACNVEQTSMRKYWNCNMVHGYTVVFLPKVSFVYCDKLQSTLKATKLTSSTMFANNDSILSFPIPQTDCPPDTLSKLRYGEISLVRLLYTHELSCYGVLKLVANEICNADVFYILLCRNSTISLSLHDDLFYIDLIKRM